MRSTPDDREHHPPSLENRALQAVYEPPGHCWKSDSRCVLIDGVVRSVALSLSLAAALVLASCSSSPVASPPTASAAPAPGQLEARPLRLPTFGAALACPTTPGAPANTFSPFGTGFTPGTGPVYPDLGDAVIASAIPTKVLWFARPSYRGSILIRGRQIDGSGVVTLGTGPDTQTSLRLASPGADASGTGGWRNWPSYTFVAEPGCYAYQVDGDTFSETIVFRATQGLLGQPGCNPPSPIDGGNEVEGTSANAELWALLFAPTPIHAGDAVKIVWRMTGSGAFHIGGTGPAGTAAPLTFGPDGPRGSSWTRPGEEWGTGFVFPTAGCWDMHAVRGTLTGDVWLPVH